MTLRLLLDENSESEQLVRLLSQRGHDVTGIRSLHHKSASDWDVLNVAIKENRILYTRDLGFMLRPPPAKYPGIIFEHHLNRIGKDMTHREIADALAALEKKAGNIHNTILVINSFRGR